MELNKHITLIGPQASGKTTIGTLLAKSLTMPVFDTDLIFLSRYGPINEHVQKYGVYSFREKESLILEEVLRNDNLSIISTGGGIVYPSGMNLPKVDVFKFSEQNKRLLENSFVVYLRYCENISEEAEELVRRKNADVQNESQRIRFDNFEGMLKTRIPHYLSVADSTILTKGLTPEEITNKILTQCYF